MYFYLLVILTHKSNITKVMITLYFFDVFDNYHLKIGACKLAFLLLLLNSLKQTNLHFPGHFEPMMWFLYPLRLGMS